MDSTQTAEAHFAVVVQCVCLRQADFASRWLAKIAEAERILAQHVKENPDFEEAVARLTFGIDTDFCTTALEMMRRALHIGGAFPLESFEQELFENFPLLAEMGFFTQEGAHYHATLPFMLNADIVISPLLRLAATCDGEKDLHPEWLLKTISGAEAQREVAMMEQTDFWKAMELGVDVWTVH